MNMITSRTWFCSAFMTKNNFSYTNFSKVTMGDVHIVPVKLGEFAAGKIGAAGSFGFPGVTQVAAQVEAAAVHCDRQGARRAFAQMMLLDELEQVNMAGANTWQV